MKWNDTITCSLRSASIGKSTTGNLRKERETWMWTWSEHRVDRAGLWGRKFCPIFYTVLRSSLGKELYIHTVKASTYFCQCYKVNTWFNRCYNHTIVAYAVSVRQASKAVSEGGSGSVRLCQRREAVRKAVLGSGRSIRGWYISDFDYL